MTYQWHACTDPHVDHPPEEEETAYGYTFSEWLHAAGRDDSASEHDLRAAWRAGENHQDYVA